MAIYMLCKENDRLIPYFAHQGFDYGFSPPDEMGRYDLILQWGVAPLSGEEKGAFILNGKEGLAHIKASTWPYLLPLSGIEVGNPGRAYRRKFLVPVFQQEAFGLYSNRGDTFLAKEVAMRSLREYPHDDRAYWARKAKNIAVRAIYALGLDFGSVLLGGSGRHWAVLAISPRFPSQPSLFRRLKERLVKLREEILLPRGSGEVMLGADLEFALQNKAGRFLLASRFFPREGEVGCDRIWLKGDRTKQKLPLAELRPAPSSDPEQLFQNIGRAIRRAAEKVKGKGIRFLAGGAPLKGYPIGGHLHFSPLPPNHFLLRALDHYLALPLFILEDPEGFSRRPKYGFLGDVRTKPHGGFEYRTLPSWITSPEITKGVLILGKLIALHYDQLRSRLLTDTEAQVAFYRGDQKRLHTAVLLLWRDLERLPEYEDYRGELEPFFEKVAAEARWDQSEDIRGKWRSD